MDQRVGLVIIIFAGFCLLARAGDEPSYKSITAEEPVAKRQTYDALKNEIDSVVGAPTFENGGYCRQLVDLIRAAERADLWDEAKHAYSELIWRVRRDDSDDRRISMLEIYLERVDRLASLTKEDRQKFWEAVDLEESEAFKFSSQQLRSRYQQAEASYAMLLGLDSLDRLNARLRRANVEIDEQLFEDALIGYEEVIAGRERLFGKSHGKVVEWIPNYVALLTHVNRHDDAIKMLKNRIQEFDSAKGTLHDRIDLICELSKLHGLMKQYDLAIALSEMADPICRGDHFIDSDQAKILYFNNARHLELTGKMHDAVEWYLTFADAGMRHSPRFDSGMERDAAEAYLRAGEIATREGFQPELTRSVEALRPIMDAFADREDWQTERTRYRTLPGSLVIVAKPSVEEH